MKKFLRYLMFILIIEIILMLPANSAAPKYVFFSNFDSFADQAYWQYILQTEHIAYYEKKSFDASFFSTHKITDYDVAFFPLGDNGVSVSSGGHTVAEEINKLILAGKHAIVISRQAISKEGSSDFFKKTLGLQFIGKKYNFSPGDSRYLGFWAHGAEADPIGLGSPKVANMGNGNNNTWPLAYYQYQDIYKIVDESRTTPVDHYCQLIQDPRTDTLVGSKTQIGDSKIVFWSMGFENLAGDVIRQQIIDRTMRWCMPDAPQPGPNIKSLSQVVAFGNVESGKTSENSFDIQNVGDKNLVIDDIYIFGMAEEGIFQITAGDDLPVTLKPMGIHSVTVKFSPKKDGEDYEDFVSVESNAVNMPTLDIVIMGSGGAVGIGPQIASDMGDNTIDFGVSPLSVDTILTIKSSGDEELIINNIDIIENDEQAFNFPQNISVPIYLPAGEEIKYKVRFAASMLDAGKKFNSRIKLESNARNAQVFFVNLKGSTETQDISDKSSDGLLSLTVSPNPTDGENIINVKLSNQSGKDAHLYMINSYGSIVKQISSAVTQSEETLYNLSPSEFSQGKYFIIARTSESRVVVPLIIMK